MFSLKFTEKIVLTIGKELISTWNTNIRATSQKYSGTKGDIILLSPVQESIQLNNISDCI